MHNHGDYVEFTIKLGTPQTPAEDIYGFVFPFPYNVDAVDPASINILWDDNNFMAYDSPVLFMEHNDLESRFDAGYTRTSGLVASGHGKLGKLGIVIDDFAGIRSDADEFILNIGGGEGASLDKFGQYNAIPVRPFELRVQLNEETEEVSLWDEDLLKTFPNPTADYLTVHLNGQQAFESVTLTNLSGQVVQRMGGLKTHHTVLDMSQLPNGVYILTVAGEKGVINRKIQVLH
ncbi:MAG: T9SS type A sorting domain-containing protein [Saprospiraceae bacterium]